MSPLVRIFNPQRPKNPRKPKTTWTYEQANNRKEKASRAARDLQGDDERADEIAAMSVEDYAADRGKEINPQLGGTVKKKVTTAQEARDNPVAAAFHTATRAVEKQQELYQQIRDLERDKQALRDKLDEIGEIIDCDDCSSEDHLGEIADVVHGKAHDDDESGEE